MSELEVRFENAVEVRQAVEDAQHDVSRKAVIVKAAQEAKLPTPVINEKIIEKILAEYRVLELVEQGQLGGWIASKGDNPSLIAESPDSGDSAILTYRDLGLTDQRLSETRKIRGRFPSADDLWQRAEPLLGADEWLSYSSLLSRGDASSYEQRRSQMSSEWYTPAYVIEAARRVLGAIDLDPASCEEANQTVQAATFYTEEDDGLTQPWFGRVWLNPPYQGLAGAFATKLVDSYRAEEINAGILLISALTTDTSWFRAMWDGTLCFTYGRIQFDGRGGQSNTAGSVLVYLGSGRDLFAQEFAALGEIVVSWRNR